jgi:hypothetical protein
MIIIRLAALIGMAASLAFLPRLVVWYLLPKKHKEELSWLLMLAGSLPILYVIVHSIILALAGSISNQQVVALNFIQHAVGGGVASGLISVYLFRNLKLKFPVLKDYRVQLVLVYALVCMLGSANELVEFALDLLKTGIYSSSRIDTWLDVLANTVGAFSGYALAAKLTKLNAKD